MGRKWRSVSCPGCRVTGDYHSSDEARPDSDLWVCTNDSCRVSLYFGAPMRDALNEPPCDPHTTEDYGCLPDIDAHTSDCCRRRGIPRKEPSGGGA